MSRSRDRSRRYYRRAKDQRDHWDRMAQAFRDWTPRFITGAHAAREASDRMAEAFRTMSQAGSLLTFHDHERIRSEWTEPESSRDALDKHFRSQAQRYTTGLPGRRADYVVLDEASSWDPYDPSVAHAITDPDWQREVRDMARENGEAIARRFTLTREYSESVTTDPEVWKARAAAGLSSHLLVEGGRLEAERPLEGHDTP